MPNTRSTPRARVGKPPAAGREQAPAAAAAVSPSVPLQHFNTRLPLIWTFRSGANAFKVLIVSLAIYCDLYHRVEQLPNATWLADNVHWSLGEKLPMFTVGGVGYLILHLMAGSFYEFLHRRRHRYSSEVLAARNVQIKEELLVFADGFLTQLGTPFCDPRLCVCGARSYSLMPTMLLSSSKRSSFFCVCLELQLLAAPGTR